MAEDSLFWTTSGTGDGASGGYTMAEFVGFLRRLFLSDETDEGVLKNYANELEVTNPSGRNLQVDTGGAFVYGYWYWNTSAETKELTHPTVGTTGWRMVLRADWSAQTVRIVLKESSDGTATAPALTQTASTTWEISLATGTIATDDTVVITDTRVYIHPNIEIEGAMLAAAIVDDSTLEINSGVLRVKDAGITLAKMGADSVNVSKTVDRTRKLWVPCVNIFNSTDSAYDQNYTYRRGWWLTDNKSVTAHGTFCIPSDFVSGMTVTPIGVVGGTGNAYTYSEATYGALGQANTTHTDTSAYAATGVVGTLYFDDLHAALSLTSAAAGDYVNLTFVRDATNAADTVDTDIYFMGWLVSYTADS